MAINNNHKVRCDLAGTSHPTWITRGTNDRFRVGTLIVGVALRRVRNVCVDGRVAFRNNVAYGNTPVHVGGAFPEIGATTDIETSNRRGGSRWVEVKTERRRDRREDG